MSIKKTLKLILLYIIIINIGCKKYLDAKSDKKLVVIDNLQDLQSLLDDYQLVNQYDPGTPEAVSDNYYLKDADYANFPDDQKNLYTWQKSHIFPEGYGNAWSQCYDNVYKANTVLFNIDKINRKDNDQSDWDNVKGQALFLRAKSFLLATSIWSLAYDSSTANSDLGIPLRMDPDFNIPSIRSSVQDTYTQIITDLKEAINLLPISAIHVLRPAKPTACALLARTYLFMREYDSCFKYANQSLALKGDLFDYNNLDISTQYPFSSFLFNLNPEILNDNNVAGPDLLNFVPIIDSTLYKSYDSNDLRKDAFFYNNGDDTYSFMGSYSGSFILWDGIATDEVYLMRAECNARLGNTSSAMSDLNTLLSKRWKTGTFTPFTAINADDALGQTLSERRKELLMRNVRWMDIKRLNKEGAGINLKRVVNGQTYNLPANDPRFALTIPEDLVTSFGIKQNP